MGNDEVWVQLATRIPKTLHRELKLSCVKSDTSLMKFVVEAIRDKLGRDGEVHQPRRRRGRAAGRPARDTP